MNSNHKLFSKFKTNFKGYVLNCYSSVAKASEVSGLGVFTDSDMSNFVIYINTINHLIEQNVKSESEDEKLTNKWWLPEWAWESNGQPDQDELFKELENISNRLEFADYKTTLFRIYCEILSELYKEKKFKNINNEFILMVQESDNFDKNKDKESLSIILSVDQWKKYIRFNKYWMGY